MKVRTGLLAALTGALALGGAGQGAAFDRRMKIVNQTGLVIVQVHGSTIWADDWQADILGPDILPSGAAVIVSFDDDTGRCRYDLRAVFEGGSEMTRADVNICEVATFTFR